MNDPEIEAAVQSSIDYLTSPEAVSSIKKDPYWPKWNSPWWHMSALFEMGMADRIPKPIAELMLEEASHTYLNYFFSEDAPPEKTSKQEAPCPCALGNMYQILTACGLDVDRALPWARSWFLKYQMEDGGLNCDEHAYAANENASSMVGTIAPLEAILSVANPSKAELEFLSRGAHFLMNRELRLGSTSGYNDEEKLDEQDWLKPSFPRFYFYDTLRGLSFLLKWSERTRTPIPASCYANVVRDLSARFPDGNVRVERHAFENMKSRELNSEGEWVRTPTASHFFLMDQLSRMNQQSPFLTREWAENLNRI